MGCRECSKQGEVFWGVGNFKVLTMACTEGHTLEESIGGNNCSYFAEKEDTNPYPENLLPLDRVIAKKSTPRKTKKIKKGGRNERRKIITA